MKADNMDDKIKDFCLKYDAYVQPSGRMHRRARRLSYQDFNDQGPALWNLIPYEDVRCVEVHMPEDRFRALLEHDQWLELEQRSGVNVGANAVRLVRQREEETRVRNEYPAVQKAWQNYQLMLKLCYEGDIPLP